MVRPGGRWGCPQRCCRCKDWRAADPRVMPSIHPSNYVTMYISVRELSGLVHPSTDSKDKLQTYIGWKSMCCGLIATVLCVAVEHLVSGSSVLYDDIMCDMQCHTISSHTMPCHLILYCTALRCTNMCYTLLYSTCSVKKSSTISDCTYCTVLRIVVSVK